MRDVAGEDSDVEGAMVAIAAMAATKGGMQTDARVTERRERKRNTRARV